MKKLDLVQMENLQGGGDTQTLICFIGIGMMFTPSIMIGAALFAVGCLAGDSKK